MDETKTEEKKIEVTSEKKSFEFSKIVITLLIIPYYVVLILGIYAVIKILTSYPEYSIQALCALFAYVSPVAAIGIREYLIKSKEENIHKYPDVQDPDGTQIKSAKDAIIAELANQANDALSSGLTAQGISLESAGNVVADLVTSESATSDTNNSLNAQTLDTSGPDIPPQ